MTGGKLDLVSSTLNGDLTLINNTVNLAQSSTANGNININGGENILSGTTETNLFNTGMGIINGDIIFNSGSLKIQDKLLINGNIDFNNIAGTIFIGKDFSKEFFTGKILNSSNALLGIDYKIDENTDYEKINNQLNMFDEIEKLKLNDEGNTINLSKITTSFAGISGGAGDDTFIVSLDNFKNDISINGGKDNKGNPYNDNDTLHLTTVVDNTLSAMLLKNIMNVETLKLADVENNNAGNNLDINNSIPSVGSNLMFKNYIGGNGADNFTVSVDNFQKLSLIDGGGNGTAGDTLKIDGRTFTNIKNDGTIDDTIFGKIQNIENLEMGESTLARLNLNNLSDDYLKNLNIKLGNSGDIITVSTEKLGKLKGLNGGNQSDSLEITNQITNENEEFSFLTKRDGTNGINSIENIYFSDEGNTINVDNLAKANNEITNINGGSGDDTFITSIETLQHIKNGNLGGRIDGGTGKDTIKINDSLDNTTNSNIFDEVYDIERLVLNKTENNILVDSLYSSSNFEEIEGIDGGTNGNIFTIEGSKTEALGVKIEGGSSVNDKLIVNTDITTEQLLNKTGIEKLELGLNKEIDYTIDFTRLNSFKNITSGNGSDHFTVSADNIGNMTIDGGGTDVDGNGNLISKDHDILKLSGILNNDTQGKENILSGVSNIEDLELDNGENILNLNNIKLGTEENGFKNIYGGNGNDTFKVSAENLGKIDILKGEIQQGIDDSDKLEITSGNIDENNTNLLNKVSGVENLILAENSSNNIDLDNLSFKNISAKNGEDIFKVSSEKLGNFNITGGIGTDTLEIKTALSNSENLKNYKEIETLKLNAGNNDIALNKENADGDSFKNINFGTSSIGNTITLANDLEGKNITFDTSSIDNIVKVDSKEVEGVETFEHTITNAGRIELAQGNSKWKFNNTISGDTTIALNDNTLELSEKLSLGTDGKLSLGDVGFVSSGKVTLENGNIKVGLSDNVTFGEGVNTLLSLESVGDIAFGNDTTLESYAFLDTVKKGNGFDITVKSWEKLLGKGVTEENKLFADTYDYILKKYYNQAEDTDKTITNAFNTFGSDAIAKYIETVTNHGLSKELVLNSESGTFESEVKGKVLIGTDETTKGNNDLTFKDISTNDFEINVAEGTENNISLNGAVTLNKGIDGLNSKGKINIALKDNSSINIGNINFGDVKGSLDIDNTSKIINLGTITNGDVTVGTADTDGFNKVLVSSNGGVENISVTEKAKIEIKNDYSGKLSFAKGENNIILNKENYTGDINFAEGKNTFTVSENGSSKGTVAILGEENTINIKGTANALTVGEKNTITVDGKLSSLGFTENSNGNNITVNGTLESGITFGANSSSNIVTVGENGKLGKNIIFGTGAGDEFNLTSKTGDFDYNIENADTINLNGKNQWKFGQNSKIVGDNVTINLNDSGEIGFNIGKSDTGLVLGKGGVNPFAEAGNYTINGDIKLTFDDTVKFTSLSDKLTGVAGNISLGAKADGTKYNIIVPEFMKYDSSKKEFSIKSAEELQKFGLKDYAFGNYEYAILNYSKAGYEGITSMLNNNSLTDISKVLNKGIDEKDHYFYSDNREIKDVATLGNINIQTSKDNQVTGDKLNTDIKFTNVTGNVANINFAQGTTNSVSFLDGVNISKIDGSKSSAGFDLTLGKVNFTAKEETKVTMSNHNDTLNINSSINDISVNTGEGNDTVNILSSIKGIFDGNDGENTLNIGAETKAFFDEKPKDEIVLGGEINSFQNINLNQNAKLESSLKITGTETIKLNGNNLFVDVDYSKVSDNKVIGHALYDSGIKVNNSTGKIMISTSEADNGTIISFGKDNKTEFVSTDKEHLLESGSSNHHIEMIEGDIVVKVNEHIMGDSSNENIKYVHLDKIYQSINSAGKIPLMSETTTLSDKTKDEAIKAQLEFYGKIYHSTPYAYTNKISKKSTELITDSLMLNDGMPEVNSWRFGGSIAGREVENSENFYGNNYYNGIDVGNTEVKAETNIYGAYAFGEYGFEEGKTVGFAVAGSKSDTDINGSSLKGNNIFVSAYVKQDINNVNMIAGIGYQRGFYDATRNVSNAYQSMKVEKDFEDNTFVGYFGAKYRYDFGNNFYLEPNGELKLTHSIQDDIKEDNKGDLSIEVDNKDFTSVDGELGVNLGKKIATENGVLNLKAGVSVNYALLGNDEEHLNARITGSSKDFEIISLEDEDRVKVNVLLKAEYQANNGMYYDVHYKTTTDNEDYSVGFGVGYKF